MSSASILKNANIPYWRLSIFYFFYFAFLGAWVPFWNLYLEQVLGFSASQIGVISSLVLWTKIPGPYLWGWLADHLGTRIRIIRVGSFLSLCCFVGVFFRIDFWSLVYLIVAYSFFWNAVLSQFEVITLEHLGEHSHKYSQIRLWGSIGFIAAVFGLGILFDYVDLGILPFILALLLLGIWVSSMSIKEVAAETHLLDSRDKTIKTFLSQLKQKEVLFFFFACFIVQFSHGPYYTFYTIYLEQLGYERSVIGGLWALGVLAEVLLFTVMYKLFARYSLRSLLLATLVLTGLRWVAIAFFAEEPVILFLAQLLHAASFGSFHAIAIEMVRRTFSPSVTGQGQAFYSAISFGLGGALGALLSGEFWGVGASQLFLYSGLIAFIASVLYMLGTSGKSSFSEA